MLFEFGFFWKSIFLLICFWSCYGLLGFEFTVVTLLSLILSFTIKKNNYLVQMGKHKLFGGIAADSFSVGDIVQWSSWNMQKQNWDQNYGIITDISSVFKSNRLVSVSKVRPLNNTDTEIEFFTLSLKMVSKVDRTIQCKWFDHQRCL